MTDFNLSDYLKSHLSSEPERRRYAQNSLIVDTAIALSKAIEIAGLSQKELASRLGRTEGFVSQVLSGGGNLTLRTLADFAYGLNCVVGITLKPQDLTSPILKGQTSWTPVSIEPAEKRDADTRLALAA